jgi:hypothetical protein
MPAKIDPMPTTEATSASGKKYDATTLPGTFSATQKLAKQTKWTLTSRLLQMSQTYRIDHN